jgi:hypothetical protein
MRSFILKATVAAALASLPLAASYAASVGGGSRAAGAAASHEAAAAERSQADQGPGSGDHCGYMYGPCGTRPMYMQRPSAYPMAVPQNYRRQHGALQNY